MRLKKILSSNVKSVSKVIKYIHSVFFSSNVNIDRMIMIDTYEVYVIKDKRGTRYVINKIKQRRKP